MIILRYIIIIIIIYLYARFSPLRFLCREIPARWSCPNHPQPLPTRYKTLCALAVFHLGFNCNNIIRHARDSRFTTAAAAAATA